ncbi:MAG: LysR family transcriptional regulator [Xanthobacteraceae bacterium]
MISSQDLAFFRAVSGSSSLAAAARLLNISPSAVTQRLSGLEERIGVRLFNRSSRRLEITAEGRFLAERGASVLAELDDIADTLSEARNAVSGHLRVAAPFGFGRKHVAPAMAALRSAHPELELTLSLFDDPLMVGPDSWDVMIHVGMLTDSTLTTVRLAANKRLLCAAPAYIAQHGAPTRPNDLQNHVCAVIRENSEDSTLWTFKRAAKQSTAVRIRPVMTSNDGEVVKQWVMAGLGLMVRSEWDVTDELADGALVQLLPDWTLPAVDIVAVFRSRSGRVQRTVRFIELFKRRLRTLS